MLSPSPTGVAETNAAEVASLLRSIYSNLKCMSWATTHHHRFSAFTPSPRPERRARLKSERRRDGCDSPGGLGPAGRARQPTPRATRNDDRKGACAACDGHILPGSRVKSLLSESIHYAGRMEASRHRTARSLSQQQHAMLVAWLLTKHPERWQGLGFTVSRSSTSFLRLC